jgi:hypothetical protein
MKPSAVRFFFSNAGYSWNPSTENRTQGRWKCAREMAQAERAAIDCGMRFEWSADGLTNREWTNEGEEYGTWQCLAYDAAGGCVASLCGIDFGNGGEPWGDNYKRVVEAELAMEAIGRAALATP